jgi:cytochrome c oxidase subunit 2
MRPSLAGLVFLTLSILMGACGAGLSEEAENGRELVADYGCVACHGDTDGIGPAWSGVWGTDRDLANGSTVVFDARYVRASLSDPNREVVKGFDPVMPAFSLSEVDLSAIIRYLEESG